MITADQREQIRTQRASRNDNRRVVSLALEEILYEPMAVLDHGFVRVVDYMGNDDAIVQAARVSHVVRDCQRTPSPAMTGREFAGLRR